MAGPKHLGEFEYAILLGVLRLQQSGDEAFGMAVHNEIVETTDRIFTPAAAYISLNRLEEKGLLSSQRIGNNSRGKKIFYVTPTGLHAVRLIYKARRALEEGVSL